jgi:hypothetical protein
MRVHKEGPECSGCSEKLKQAHPFMREWFFRKKKTYENLHVYRVWSDKEEQDRYFKEGSSKLPWPKSPHNYVRDGRPCSLALDVFLINEDGEARFPPLFYAKLNEENERDREPIRWGGTFKTLRDANHFELRIGELLKA